MRPETSRPRV
ncbi:hypothetical protein D046_8305A, partial [Vibrio parahaemolyticus V-223/04]